MNKTLTRKFSITDRKAACVLSLLVLAFVVLTLTQDFLRSDLKNSAFYFSETLIFSSFWWLFAPLLLTQYFAVNYKYRKLEFQIAIIILPVFLHVIAFPFLVWVLSKLFYYHTYSYQQTFRYTLSEHLYLLVLFYSIPFLTFQFFSKKAKLAEPFSDTQNESVVNHFISTIIVSDGNKTYSIIVSQILYFSATPPYISLHLEGKKYLHNETLKSILLKLNPDQFVRVHKSTIVNIKTVASYSTRLNGDYDLKMINDVQLRVSRKFATNFKNLFNKTHHLTTK